MIDLHLHTTCSDGQYTPSELVAKAKAAGITAIVLPITILQRVFQRRSRPHRRRESD